MKRKLMTLGLITIMTLTCAGCGKKETVTDEVAQVTEAATEEATEESTEDATKETSKKADKDNKTAQAKNNKTDKDKDTGKQRTTEAASSRTSNSTASSSTGQSSASTPAPSTEQPSTRQPSTSAPSTEQPSTRQPSTQSCNHNWVEITQTVHHEAEMGERCIQSAVIYHWYCRICGCYYPDVNSDPCGGVNGSDADYTAQDAVYETYVVTPAYDETVGTGRYRCSRCGATK